MPPTPEALWLGPEAGLGGWGVAAKLTLPEPRAGQPLSGSCPVLPEGRSLAASLSVTLYSLRDPSLWDKYRVPADSTCCGWGLVTAAGSSWTPDSSALQSASVPLATDCFFFEHSDFYGVLGIGCFSGPSLVSLFPNSTYHLLPGVFLASFLFACLNPTHFG